MSNRTEKAIVDQLLPIHEMANELSKVYPHDLQIRELAWRIKLLKDKEQNYLLSKYSKKPDLTSIKQPSS